ncbi:MAG: protein kinase [Myxococcaceae bacterium]|nr:protein kinase [Myxococcaceae bacterium]
MAEVYAARRIGPDGSVGPLVALKRLMPHLIRDPTVVRMFLNEARITAQIDHPNVVRVLDLGHHNNEPYIAMELLIGHSFAELRQKAADRGERVPLGITLRVLTEACRGLDAAHRVQDENGRHLSIVHRDFTPDNIHVGNDGRVKVIDFGIAKAENLGAGTEPGTLKGKFFYMSPEMIAGRPVDHRADLYAAGVMLYEQLCGRRPFTGSTPDEVLDRISQARPRRPTEFDPSVPPALEAVCLQALRRHPEERFGSLEEFIHAIESIRGAAELATEDELRAYCARLFPPGDDALAAAVANARLLDPSVPRAAGSDEIPLSARTPRPRLAGEPGGPAPTPTPSSSAPTRVERGLPAPPPAPTPRVPPRRKFRVQVLAVAIGAVAALSAAAYVAISREPIPAAERLALAERADEREARAGLLSGIADDPDATDAQLERAGELLLDKRAYDAALELATEWQRRAPKVAAAKLLEARACIGLRQGKSAEAAIDAARALDSKSPEPELVLADLKELQGDLPGASAALAAALKKDPSSLKVARRQGLLLSQSGRLEEAEATLGAVLRRQFDAQSAAELAFVKYRQDRPQDALALLKRALRADPKLAAGHYYLGAVLYRTGDARGAERAYREAMALAPDDPRPVLSLCELYMQTHRKDDLPELHKLIDEKFEDRAAALKRQCGG